MNSNSHDSGHPGNPRICAEAHDYVSEAISSTEWHIHAINKVLASAVVHQQQVRVVLTAHGRSLLIGARLQSAEADEWIYHETLVHPAMVLHAAACRVLCVGGSTGAILREVLRWTGVDSAVFVEAQPELVSMVSAHLPFLGAETFRDARVELVFSSFEAWAATQPAGGFDVIITDPLELPSMFDPGARFYSPDSIVALRRMLRPRGVLAMAAGSAHRSSEPMWPRVNAWAMRQFSSVIAYSAWIPSFGTSWGFVLASDGDRLGSEPDDEQITRTLEQGGARDLRYYDAQTHRQMLMLPRYLRAWLCDYASA